MKSLSEKSQQQSVLSSGSQWSLCSHWLVETGEPLTAARQTGAGWKKSGNFQGKTEIILASSAAEEMLGSQTKKSNPSSHCQPGRGRAGQQQQL